MLASHFSRLSLLSLCFLIFTPSVQAQIAISLEVQQVYDDNIFLEDDIGMLSPESEAALAALPEEQRDAILNLEKQNGDPDSDFITLANIGLNGALNLGDVAQIGIDTGAGVAIFSDFDDENRFLLDSLIKLSLKEELLPRPFAFSVASEFRSGSNNIAVAEGSVARQTEQHTGSVSLGILDYEIANQTSLGLGYQFNQVNFLGEFRFDDDEIDLPPALDPDDQGSDYSSHNLNLEVNRPISQKAKAGIFVGLRKFNFSEVKSDDFEGNEEEDLDRLDWFFGLRGNMQISESVQFSASVGADFSKFDEERMPRTVTVTDLSGVTNNILVERDDEESSLSFGATLAYAPPGTGLTLSTGVDQRSGTDVDGERIISRGVSANASYIPVERFLVTLGGSFNEFDQGDSLSDGTERFATTVALRYEISESMNVGAGWSYTNQESKDDSTESFLFRSDDYESNKAFVNFNMGLVGLPF